METHIKSLTDLVGSLIDNNNKRKYDEEDNEKRRKKARTYVERQNLPQSSKRKILMKMMKCLLTQGHMA